MKKKGAALLVVIIIMMLTFLLAAIMFQTSIKHLRVSNDRLDSTKAYYSAETGVYDAINYIKLMAETGSFYMKGIDYIGHDIAISNLYSLGENTLGSKNYLFGDPSAIYTASIKLLDPISTKANQAATGSTLLIDKIYNCEINSKGTYNDQNYLINDSVSVYYDSGRWMYKFTKKLSTKD